MALLARAPIDLLEHGLQVHLVEKIQWLRRPETGLMMVQGRVGNSGDRFNVGEVTVTRCALRLKRSGSDSEVGIAYVLGRNHRHAELAAVADALLQDAVVHIQLVHQLLEPIRRHLELERQHRHHKAQSTRVDFLTMSRESGTPQGDEAA